MSATVAFGTMGVTQDADVAHWAPHEGLLGLRGEPATGGPSAAVGAPKCATFMAARVAELDVHSVDCGSPRTADTLERLTSVLVRSSRRYVADIHVTGPGDVSSEGWSLSFSDDREVVTTARPPRGGDLAMICAYWPSAWPLYFWPPA